MIKIKYNRKFEVTEAQHLALRVKHPGVIAYRQEEGKFFIKVMIPKYIAEIEEFMNKI